MNLNLPEYVRSKYWCKSYPDDLPAEVSIPQLTLPQLIEQAIEANQDRVAMVYCGEEITYGALKSQIHCFASGLHALGVTKGQTVALFLSNCPQFAVAYYGALKLGAVVTALSPLFMTPEVDFQLKDSRAQTLVIHEAFWPRLEPLLGRLPLGHVILVGQERDGPSVKPSFETHFFKDLLSAETLSASPVAIDPQTDVAALQYTGGTTGRPKDAVREFFWRRKICPSPRLTFKWLLSRLF